MCHDLKNLQLNPPFGHPFSFIFILTGPCHKKHNLLGFKLYISSHLNNLQKDLTDLCGNTLSLALKVRCLLQSLSEAQSRFQNPQTSWSVDSRWDRLWGNRIFYRRNPAVTSLPQKSFVLLLWTANKRNHIFSITPESLLATTCWPRSLSINPLSLKIKCNVLEITFLN